ncbi:MAG: hypothetical protein WB439_13780 [Acidobacteriaceae bacterium]
MADPVDKEIAAIRTVLGALEPLPFDVRANVLEYVLKRLSIQLHSSASIQGTSTVVPASVATPAIGAEGVHIEQLKDTKKPRSVNEMAALVAYYLAEVAPLPERKSTVTTEDIRRYFKIARFPLPRQPRATLLNAKAAGYFDSAGGGEFRLNPVGYNLVVHAMPRGQSAAGGRPRRPKKAKRAARR